MRRLTAKACVWFKYAWPVGAISSLHFVSPKWTECLWCEVVSSSQVIIILSHYFPFPRRSYCNPYCAVCILDNTFLFSLFWEQSLPTRTAPLPLRILIQRTTDLPENRPSGEKIQELPLNLNNYITYGICTVANPWPSSVYFRCNKKE